MTFFKQETPSNFSKDVLQIRANKACTLLREVYGRQILKNVTPTYYPLPSGYILFNFIAWTKYGDRDIDDSVLAIVNPDAKIATEETVKEIFREKHHSYYSGYFGEFGGIIVDQIDADGVITFHTEYHNQG